MLRYNLFCALKCGEPGPPKLLFGGLQPPLHCWQLTNFFVGPRLLVMEMISWYESTVSLFRHLPVTCSSITFNTWYRSLTHAKYLNVLSKNMMSRNLGDCMMAGNRHKRAYFTRPKNAPWNSYEAMENLNITVTWQKSPGQSNKGLQLITVANWLIV